MTKEPKQFQKEIFKPNIKREPFMFLLNLAPELRNADLVTRSSLFYLLRWPIESPMHPLSVVKRLCLLSFSTASPANP